MISIRVLTLSLILLVCAQAQAVKIQFPEQELASESVLPKFDNPEPVKNRNIITAGHLELTGMFGWTLSDAFADSQSMGAIFTYHFNEFHGLQFFAAKLSGKENEYPEQIKQDTGADIVGKVAVPKAAYIVAYEVTPYYGKFSITKQGVLNMSFYGTAGAGSYQLEDQNAFTLSAGIGTKLYFAKRWNTRIDYRYFFYNARDPIREDYGKRAQINSILTVGIGFLL